MSSISSSLDDSLSDRDAINEQINRSNFINLHGMDPVEMEQQNDIKEGKLESILLRLEKKGQKQNILKYREMQKLRAKHSKRVIDRLEQFGAGDERCIIDSS